MRPIDRVIAIGLALIAAILCDVVARTDIINIAEMDCVFGIEFRYEATDDGRLVRSRGPVTSHGESCLVVHLQQRLGAGPWEKGAEG